MRFLTVVLIFVIADLSAQQYAFKVLINKGDNEVRSGNEWVGLKVGANLGSDDEVRIGRNGYLGLVHVSGKPLEVKKPGRHKIADLAGSIEEGSGVLNKYTDFILSTRPEPQTNLTVTGSVYRGTGTIKIALPQDNNTVVFNNEIAIAWTKDEGTPSYVVQFNSMFGDALYSVSVRDTAVVVDLNDPALVDEDNIVVRVVSGKDPVKTSDNFMLKRLSQADRKRIASALTQITSVTTEENALNRLYQAAFYEENALLIDASTAYRQAIGLAPDVPYYREAYDLFISRNGL